MKGDEEHLKSQIDFNRIHNTFDSIDYDQESSLSTLVSFINNNSNNDAEIAYSVYYWVNTNIIYDNSYSGKALELEEIFDQRRGVCEHYSELFAGLCEKLNINSTIIEGYVLNYDYDIDDPLLTQSHAWNAFSINEAWYLVDCTWGIFCESPDIMRKTHCPLYKKWELL